MTMFQMIDALEPIIPQAEMDALYAVRHTIWVRNNPEAHREIIQRYNAKRTQREEENK